MTAATDPVNPPTRGIKRAMPVRRLAAFMCWCLAVTLVTGFGFVGALEPLPSPTTLLSGGKCDIRGPFGPKVGEGLGWKWVYKATAATALIRGIVEKRFQGDLQLFYSEEDWKLEAGVSWSVTSDDRPVQYMIGSEVGERAYGWPNRMFVRRSLSVATGPADADGKVTLLPSTTVTVWLFDGVAWNIGLGAVPTLILPTLLISLRRFVHRSFANRRLNRGLCPKCGYDWQMLPQCPECGEQRG